MNAEEMQSKITGYEQRINDYERKRVRYERMIGRLQDDLLDRDNEILRAKFTVVQALPELNGPDLDPVVDHRVPGYLDIEIFERACLDASLRDPSSHWDDQKRKDEAYMEAAALRSLWRDRVHGDWMLYIVQEGIGDIQMERPEILDVKEKYGPELYNTIKKAWFEYQERRRTGVVFKPWNYDAGREQTLTELLAPLAGTIDNLRNPPLFAVKAQC